MDGGQIESYAETKDVIHKDKESRYKVHQNEAIE
jgi:hypothetical protein